MAPKMPEEHSDFRKKQILMAAWKCFIEKGYDDTTIRDIAGHMGLSTGTIYNYFSGKANILDALQDWSIAEKQKLFKRMERSADLRSAFALIFEPCMDDCGDGGVTEGARGDISMWAQSVKREELKAKFIEQVEFMRERIAHVTRTGIERGELRSEVDPDALARVIIAVSLGLEVLVAFFDTELSRGDVRRMRDALLTNIWNK